ncbi:hypothetical protein LCGC14_1805250, partial [marine sediment metagenome]
MGGSDLSELLTGYGKMVTIESQVEMLSFESHHVVDSRVESTLN